MDNVYKGCLTQVSIASYVNHIACAAKLIVYFPNHFLMITLVD